MSDEVQIAPPQNKDEEIGVLGTLMMSDAKLPELLTLVGLREEHFYWPRHQLVFRAMMKLADGGDPVDAVTVVSELERAQALEEAGGAAYVHSLQTMVANAGAVATYAERVVEDAMYRRQMSAGRQIFERAAARDADGVAEAEGRLAVPTSQDILETEDVRRDALWDHFARENLDLVPWPFRRMNEMTGGHWPGTLAVVIGWSGHGKSVFVDQCLEAAAKHGARCALYRTEQTHKKRDMRLLARRTGIPLMDLMFNKNLSESQRAEIGTVLGEPHPFPFEMLNAGGMTAREIGRDIQRRGWDIVAIDLLNATTGGKTYEIDQNIAYLAGLAARTNKVFLGCQHLNRFNLEKGDYPHEPRASDIRGSSAIHDLADIVLSVHRFKEEGDPNEPPPPPGHPPKPAKKSEDGRINFLKVKEGMDDYFDVRFNGNRMRFEPTLDPGSVGAS